jgi:hypothetical protein
MIDLGAVRSNQNVSMMEVDDQVRQEQQRQEEIARQHQAELLQEELCAAQEQEQQHQEEATSQHQDELCTAQEHQRQAEVARQHQEEEAARIQQEQQQWQQQLQDNFTVKLKNGQQQEVDPFINVATRKVRQSPQTAALTEMSKKGKENNRDSVASQRKQKRDGIRKSLRIIVVPSVDNEVHGNEVQHAAPSAAEHRAKIEQIDALENDFLRDLQGF